MGMHRGQCNRDQDRYWRIRQRAEQGGMVAADITASAICLKCQSLVLREQLHKGWCIPCVSKWAETTDPWLIYQAQSDLPVGAEPRSVLKRMGQLEAFIAEPAEDHDFLALTQYMGSRGVGHQRTMWNFLHAMYLFEIETTGQAMNMGKVWPNTTHLCGRHAPVQRSSIQGFMSRVFSAGSEFPLFERDRRFVDYIRGFCSDNRLWLFRYRKTSVNVWDREKTRKFLAKFGKTHFDKHLPVYWPFEGNYDGKLREEGKLEELPDIVMQVGDLVPTRMPSTLREDLCQDLVVAVLSNEITIDDLRVDAFMKRYIREAFRHHPLKYGRYSLDTFTSDADDDYRLDRVTSEDIDPSRAERGYLEGLVVDPGRRHSCWHEGRGRNVGLTTLGEVARSNNDGHAIDGPDVVTPEVEGMDDQIAEVYAADRSPQWRRTYSGR